MTGRTGRLFRTGALALAVGLGGLAGVGAVAAPAAAAVTVSETYQRPASGSWVVDGHGWGHGIGMSQYGAQGAALSGVGSPDTVMAFYYPGTQRTSIGNPVLRVGLVDAPTNTVQVAVPADLVATDAATGHRFAPPTGSSALRVVPSGGALVVQARSGAGPWATLAGATGLAGPVDLTDTAALLRLAFPDGTQRDYRGTLRAVATGSGVTAVNVVPMESYLRAVVPREMPASWAPVALQSQAIAARTYADYARVHHAADPYDICDTTACQVYGGAMLVSATGVSTPLEAAATDAAITATAGIVRTVGGAPIFSQFSSSNGGYTVAGSQPYLPAQPDPWDGVPSSTVHTWQATLRVSDLEASFGAALGSFDSMTVTARDGHGDWGGRVLTVLLRGHTADGTPTVISTTGARIAQVAAWPSVADGLRSAWWHVRGAAPGRAVAPATLTAGQQVLSPSGQYRLVMQNDGNVVEYGNGAALWATHTGAYPGSQLEVRTDGTWAVVAPGGTTGTTVWSSPATGAPGATVLAVQDDGNVVLYVGSRGVWANHAPGSDVLAAGGSLTVGQALLSRSRAYRLLVQADGNLVVYGPRGALWASRTSGAAVRLVLQADGNLVLYRGSTALWASRTAGAGGGARLAMQNDGNLVLYAARGAVWATHT